MQSLVSRLRYAVLVILVAGLGQELLAADFYSLSEFVTRNGHAPFGGLGTQYEVTDISEDGTTFVGQAPQIGPGYGSVFRYNAETGFAFYGVDAPIGGTLVGERPFLADSGQAMAWTGVPENWIIGTPTLQAEYLSPAGRTRIGPYGPGQFSSVSGISGNGRTVLGRNSGPLSLLLSSAGGVTLPEPQASGDASLDYTGSRIAIGDKLWTNDSGNWQDIGLISTDLSDDGTVVGQTAGSQAARWTQQGIESLGMLPGDSSSIATGIASGSGYVFGSSDNEAFVWKDSVGMRPLKELIRDDLSVEAVEGWSLDTVTEVSRYGEYLVGTGTNPSGRPDTWVADLSSKTYVLTMGVDWFNPDGSIDLLGTNNALNVAASFSQLPNVEIEPAILLDSRSTNNKTALIDAIEATKAKMFPGDTLVFYEFTHGVTQLDFEVGPGDETSVLTDVPGQPGVRRPSTHDEVLSLSRTESISDDEFAALFNDSDWDAINKLFILESCYAGGFWGDNLTSDSGDLSQLAKTSLITAGPDGRLVQAANRMIGNTVVSTEGYLNRALTMVLDELVSNGGFWDVDRFSAELQDLTSGLIDAGFFGDDQAVYIGVEDFWGVPLTPGEVEADISLRRTSDFEWFYNAGDARGDFNADGAVDQLDYQFWAQLYGQTVPEGVGPDGNGDGQIDAADYTVWREAFQPQLALVVPEPATILCVLSGLVAMLPRRGIAFRSAGATTFYPQL